MRNMRARLRIKILDMGKEFRLGLMDQNILECEKMIVLMERVNLSMVMVTYMMVTGKMIKQMEMEYIYIQMVQNIKENGKMICSMEQVLNIGLMEASMKGNSIMESNKAKEFSNLITEVFMRVSL